MVIGDAVAGNRVAYTPYPNLYNNPPSLLGCIVGTNGPMVQVLFDVDIARGNISEVDPRALTLSTDGGYFGDVVQPPNLVA